MRTFDFTDLFVFEMANNHQGDVQHGIRIIDAMADLADKHRVRAAVKLQFRDLTTFVHPSHRDRSDNRHVPRFLSTALDRSNFAKLLSTIRDREMVTMVTPFDEPSVELCGELGVEVLKIGSPSARDWPLIEAAAETGLPMLFSTGGLSLKQIDDVVSFFEHRMVEHALMHCVSVYPTPNEDLQLAQIEQLRKRYPSTVVGWSGHEDPDDVLPVQLAVALGARIYERHVGIPFADAALNAYSMSPEQVDRWLTAYSRAVAACGDRSTRPAATPEEIESLDSLQRGVFAADHIDADTPLERRHIYFAMPKVDGQLTAGEWEPGTMTRGSIDADEPVMHENIEFQPQPVSQEIYTAIHTVKAMLNESKIPLPTDFKLEISHHYGMERFDEFGTVIIDCINRSYCKKLLVQLPGQKNPLHYHERKEETFQVLSGVLEVEIDGRRRTLHPGETLLVQPGVWHAFWATDGAIFEEISTTHYNDDSFYADKAINRMERSERKTVVDHWGRNQIRSR